MRIVRRHWILELKESQLEEAAAFFFKGLQAKWENQLNSAGKLDLDMFELLIARGT